MRVPAEHYYDHLQALLPSGAAWSRDPSGTLGQFLLAMADGLARAHNRATDLTEEVDPRATMDMLADWERITGLPDPCSGSATTAQERRVAIVSKLTSRGGQSVAYFAALIAGLGYSASIEEFRPFITGRSQCGDRLTGPHAIRHTWRVTVHGPRLTLFRAGGSRVGEHLGKYTRAEDLECLLQRLKPAHSTLIITYEGV